MARTITEELRVSNEDILEAIRLLISEVFPAMNIANAVAGMQTMPWKIIRQWEIDDIFAEAKERGLDISGLKGAVTDRPIQECPWAQEYLEK